MNFFVTKNLKLRELEELNNQINQLETDPNRTANTGSAIRLCYERDCKMQELMIIFNEEKAMLTRSRDHQIMNAVLDQHGGNVHEDGQYVI